MDMEVRNYTTPFGSTFDRRLKVDVTLDTKEAIQHKLLSGGHALMEQADTRLPRIAIQINGINPDINRYAGKNFPRLLTKTITNGSASATIDVQPYPVTIEYGVGIWCKYFEHYSQILENIIPFFDPYVTCSVRERNYGIERELRISLTSVGQQLNFNYQTGQNQSRMIRGDLTFTVDTIMYKTKDDNLNNLIQNMNINIIDIVSPLSSETITISAGPTDSML
jgi:hypothetical protein